MVLTKNNGSVTEKQLLLHQPSPTCDGLPFCLCTDESLAHKAPQRCFFLFSHFNTIFSDLSGPFESSLEFFCLNRASDGHVI